MVTYNAEPVPRSDTKVSQPIVRLSQQPFMSVHTEYCSKMKKGNGRKWLLKHVKKKMQISLRYIMLKVVDFISALKSCVARRSV